MFLWLLFNTSWGSTWGGVEQLSPIRAVIVTKSFCAKQSQVVISSRLFHETPTALELCSYPLLELLLSQKAAAAWQFQIFCVSSSILLKNPKRDGVGQQSPKRAVIGRRSSCMEKSQVFMPPLQYFFRLSTGVELGSYPLLELLLSQKAPAAWHFQVFVSTRQFFLRIPSEIELGSNPLIELLWNKKLLLRAVATFCVSLSILIETPNRCDIGQICPIRAVIVTRSSCAEQFQVLCLLVNTS